MDGIVDGAKTILRTIVHELQSNLEAELKEQVMEKQLGIIQSVFQNVSNPFAGRSQQSKYKFNYLVCIKSTHNVNYQCHMQEPTERVLGRHYEENSSGIAKEVTDCSYDIYHSLNHYNNFCIVR